MWTLQSPKFESDDKLVSKTFRIVFSCIVRSVKHVDALFSTFPSLYCVRRFTISPTKMIGPRDCTVDLSSISLLSLTLFISKASPRLNLVLLMLGIKRTTVNQAQLNLIPTHSLASQVVSRGSAKQHRELSHFLSDTAVNQVSATGQDIDMGVTM